MSTLLENINGIIKIFHKYSKTDKEADTLSKKELKELLEVEFRPVLKVKVICQIKQYIIFVLHQKMSKYYCEIFMSCFSWHRNKFNFISNRYNLFSSLYLSIYHTHTLSMEKHKYLLKRSKQKLTYHNSPSNF